MHANTRRYVSYESKSEQENPGLKKIIAGGGSCCCPSRSSSSPLVQSMIDRTFNEVKYYFIILFIFLECLSVQKLSYHCQRMPRLVAWNHVTSSIDLQECKSIGGSGQSSTIVPIFLLGSIELRLVVPI